MMPTEVNVALPDPWKQGTSIKISKFGTINFLVGPNGSGKSRFAESLKSSLGKARLLGTDRLHGMSKSEGLGFLGDNFSNGLQKNWFSHLKQAGINFGNALDTFILLDERPDLRIMVESTLGHLFNRTISLEWDSGHLVPKATLEHSGLSYRVDRDECHGIKELLVLLTHLYNDEYPFLIIDEPELNLHPQFQAFFMQEARKIAGIPQAGTSKKVLFLITHSPFIIDLRSVADLKSVISFDWAHSEPKRLSDIDDKLEERLSTLIPRLNVHHKQLFFSDNPIFVEGILDARMIEAIQEHREVSITAAGSCLIDVGGCEEVNKYIELCRRLTKNAYFLYDLDSLFTGTLRQCIRADEQVTDFLAKLGLGASFSKYCGELDRRLSEAVNVLRVSEPGPCAGLKAYIEGLSNDGELQDKQLQKARLAVLVELARSAAELAQVLSAALIADIQGRLKQVIEALRQVRIIVLPGGALEHYLPSYAGNRYEINESAKRAAVDAEVALLASRTPLDLKKRYCELIDCIEELPAKPAVDFDATLKRYLSDFIHEIQGLVLTHPTWGANEISAHYSKSSSALGRLFKITRFVRTNGTEFVADISVPGTDGRRTVNISHETNAGMRKFTLPLKPDQQLSPGPESA